MESQSRLLFVLAAVLLALVALIVLVEPPAEDGDPGMDDGHTWERMLPGRDAHSVRRLTIDLDGERRTFSRDDAGWRIAEPLDVAADADAVEALVDSFTSAEVEARPLDGDLEEYGLRPPRAVATLEFADGETAVVSIGRDAPTGWHTYVRLGDDSPPRITRTRLSAGIDEPLDEYRDHRVWTLSWDDVDEVRLDGPRARVELTRHDDAWWVRAALAGPGEPAPELEEEPRKAADSLVDRALASLRRMRVEGFADDLDPQATELPWRVTVRSAGVVHEIALAEDEDGWLARVPLHRGLVRLPDGWQEDWLLPVPQWWAKEIEPAWQVDGEAEAADEAAEGSASAADGDDVAAPSGEPTASGPSLDADGGEP